MKRLLLLSAALLLMGQTSVQTIPGDGGPIRFDAQGRTFVGGGQLIITSPAPAISSCGGGSPAIDGSDFSGTITAGTTATGCIVTFTRAWPSAPICLVSWAGGPLASMSWTVTASALTIVQTSTSGNTINYICTDKQ